MVHNKAAPVITRNLQQFLHGLEAKFKGIKQDLSTSMT